MQITDYFCDGFFENNGITVEKAIVNNANKSLTVKFHAKALLALETLQELLKSIQKMEVDLRKFKVYVLMSYDELRLDDEVLYLKYFDFILKNTIVDYQFLSLTNLAKTFNNGTYTLDSEKSPVYWEKTIDKAVDYFKRFGLDVKIEINQISNEILEKLKEEIMEKEAEEIKRNIEEVKEVEKKQEYIAELQRKPKKYASEEAPVSPISDIPATQAGIDEYINTQGSTNFTVQGEIFAIESRELAKGSILYEIKITDGTDSIMIKKFVKSDVDKELYQSFHEGDEIKVFGNAQYDNYAREVTLNIRKVTYIGKKEKAKREDSSTEKRVELHLHTNMSALDGLTDISEYVAQAAAWGHKAIALTDHNGLYAVPDLFKACKKNNIKPIVGVELNYIDETKQKMAFTEGEDIPLREATYCVFDIETTGFSTEYDTPIQIAAVKYCQNQKIAEFNEFVNPNREISETITELTSITNDMVRDADTIDKVLPRFLEFMEGCIIVGQNVAFDMGHIYHQMNVLNLPGRRDFPVIDTMQIARNFHGACKENPDGLKKFNLKALAKFYKVKQEQHHIANDDARVTGEIFLQQLQDLYKRGVTNYKDINSLLDSEAISRYAIPKHINLLVTTQDGYKNLFKIVSDSLTTHFYGEARCLRSVIDKYRDGILVGSGCVNGEVFRTALEKPYEELLEVVKYYDYLEVQPPKAMQQIIDQYDNGEYIVEETIKRIIKAGNECGKLVVATGDCHYISRDLKAYRDIYIASPQIGGGLHPLSRVKNTPQMHFRATDEMIADFMFLGAEIAHQIVITNTNLIADKVEKIAPFKEGLFSPADDEFKDSLGVPSIEGHLKEIVETRAFKDYGNPLPQYVKDRLDKELNSIISHGFSPVYYMAYLLVHKSNSDGYVVGSRGSVGSSLVATMMSITEVNALAPHYRCPNCHFSVFKFNQELMEKYGLTEEQKPFNDILQNVGSGYDLPDRACPCCGTNLLKDGQDIPFETFLGFDGDKVPDIDLNFSGEYQPRAHEYVRTLMGPENAFRAGTVATVAENTAIGYVKGYLEKKGITKRQTEIVRMSKKIIDVRRSTGQHPGGIVVVPHRIDIFDVTPIQYPADDTEAVWRTTHFDYHKFEENLLKLDILGHDDPTTLRFIFNYVDKHQDEFPFSTPQGIPLDDPDIYKMFHGTEVIGVNSNDLGSEVATFAIPEMGTNFTRKMLVDTQPGSFADLVKISGLSHGTGVWQGNCDMLVRGETEFGAIPFSKLIGCRDDIMVQLIYYGLPSKDAFDIMEFVRKGKLHKDPKNNGPKWEKYKELMKEHNVDPWYIWSCEQIEYMFPKAHAVAYIQMAMRIAWFKIHKPELFYSAFFSIRAGQFEPENMMSGPSRIKERKTEIEAIPKKTAKDEDLINMYNVALEMLLRGIKFLQVDIMKSHSTHFLIEDGGLRLPFIAVQGLGESVALDIVAKREEKAFTSKQDVQKRTKLNKSLFDKMEALGSFGTLKEEDDLEETGLFALL